MLEGQIPSYLGAQHPAEVYTARRVSPRPLQWHPDGTKVVRIYQTDFESDIAVRTTVAVCEYGGALTTRPYTSQGYGVVKFSSVSGTSTTDTEQKGWLNRLWFMLENDKPSFLLTLWANANCGWHGAMWHNLTGSGWFYYPEPDVVKFPNLCRTSTTDTVKESLPFPALPDADHCPVWRPVG